MSGLDDLIYKIEEIMSDVTDPNLWDGDESAEWIYAQFIEWLPDMIRHQEAEKIRNASYPAHVTDGADYAADLIDPFRLDAGEWIRKSDNRPVPERVAALPDIREENRP